MLEQLQLIPKLVLNTHTKIFSIGKPQEYVYKRRGLSFYIRNNTTDRFIVDENLMFQPYETDLKPDAVVVDIGGHVGSFSVNVAKQIPRGQIYAFEPMPTNHHQFSRNVELNNLNNVELMMEGVSGRGGDFDLCIFPDNTGGHSLISKDSYCEKITVNTTTLQKIIERFNLKKIDLLKIDAEGVEYEIIFTTPPEILSRINRIVLEFHDDLVEGYNYRDLVKFLGENGFKVKLTTPRIWVKMFKSGVLVCNHI